MPVNIPISTCVSSSPHGVNSQVRLSVSAFATIERRWMENRGSKKQQRQEREQRRGERRRRRCGEVGGSRLITVAGLVAWRRLGRGMPGC